MDISDHVVADLYHQYHDPHIMPDYVLGFDIDHRVTNFSVLRDDYVYSQDYVESRYAPGLMIREYQILLTRYVCEINVNRFRMRIGQDVQAIDVMVNAMYNGSDIAITSISSHDERINSVRYIDVVLMLYKTLTGTGLGMLSYKYESETTLSLIPPIKYTPVTSTYVDMLYSISDAAVINSVVCVNRKYDGQAMWIYMSPTTPASLLYQVKNKNSISHKYVGRISDLPDSSLTDHHCLLVEKMEFNGQHLYIVTDAFSSVDETYLERMSRAAELLSVCYNPLSRKYTENITPQTIGTTFSLSNIIMKLGLTKPSVISTDLDKIQDNISISQTEMESGRRLIAPYAECDRDHVDIIYDVAYNLVEPNISTNCVGHLRCNHESIVDIMSIVHVDTDGYVVYIGDNRPIKVKLADMITLDIEYDKSSCRWNCPDNISCKLKTPAIDMLMSTNDNIVVMEVNLHTGDVIRLRGDRMRGNSKMVIDKVVRSYNADIKYSNIEVWSSKDIRFSLFVNRAFKRFMYLKYIPRNYNLLDVGSGNGGDVDIWEYMQYKVLALERDESRFKVLVNRIGTNQHMRAVCDDMRNMLKHLRNSTVRYHGASFMRSLGTLTADEVHTILSALKAYGCKRVLTLQS